MSNYDASSIEVLTGLEPVKKRPGMYTNTEIPNYLAQEVMDNSVDEAVSGYAQLGRRGDGGTGLPDYGDNALHVLHRRWNRLGSHLLRRNQDRYGQAWRAEHGHVGSIRPDGDVLPRTRRPEHLQLAVRHARSQLIRNYVTGNPGQTA